jgi:hypothetical protein
VPTRGRRADRKRRRVHTQRTTKFSSDLRSRVA